MDTTALIVQLIGGAVGGLAVGKTVKSIDLGTVINAIAGIVGGGIGGQILNSLGIAAMPSGQLDVASIIGNVVSGGAGGGILLAIVGFIKSLLKK
jgi:uncharacterized membrane protein YeaQ/YmgE (transglycosylase-associated protein family)